MIALMDNVFTAWPNAVHKSGLHYRCHLGVHVTCWAAPQVRFVCSSPVARGYHFDICFMTGESIGMFVVMPSGVFMMIGAKKYFVT